MKRLCRLVVRQAPSLGKLDRARLVKLLEHPRLPSSISHQEAQVAQPNGTELGVTLKMSTEASLCLAEL